MLHLVIGPMWSCKTTHVIRLARRYRAIGKNVLFVDHACDTRYASRMEGSAVVSHDGLEEECIFLERLELLRMSKEYQATDVVVIEEAQFFPDAFQFISREADASGKDFIVSGLAGDYKREPIGDILLLIPHAEIVDKLNGLCIRCKNGTLGAFTRRTVNDKEQVIIGGKEVYECVCRRHFNHVESDDPNA